MGMVQFFFKKSEKNGLHLSESVVEYIYKMEKAKEEIPHGTYN